MKRQLPKYVYSIKGRLYFRRGARGAATPMIVQDDQSPAFWAEYARRLNGIAPAPKGKTWKDLIVSYERSERWKKLAPRTKADYGKITAFIQIRMGHLEPAKMKRKDVIRLRDENAERMRFANYLVQVVSILMEHARDIDMIGNETVNPAKGVDLLKSNREKREPWPDDKVKAFRAAYAYGTRERLIFELLIGTGQRIGDVLKMQWGHIKDGGIRVKQNKTGKLLWVPLTPHLRAALDVAPRRALTILTLMDGSKPLSYRMAADEIMAARIAIGAEAHDIHSLRHTAASELATAGCTDELIAAVTGQSMQMVARYTATVRQKVRAIAAQKMRE